MRAGFVALGLRIALAFTCAIAATAPAAALAQAAPQRTDTLTLDLARVAQLAAERSTSVEVERLASVEAQAKVREDRAALLPNLSLNAINGRRTFNTASFGIDFPTPPGQPPIFDPNGEVIGPVTTIDFRGLFGQTLFDLSAYKRLESARASYEASRIGTDAARARAAFGAAAAYVQAVRAAGRLAAREADLSVADELLGIAKEQLNAGVGVRLDVTRAEAQEAALRADLVTTRSAADRTRLALLRALSLPLDTPVKLVATVADTLASEHDAERAVADALERRADVQELEQRITAARLDVSAVRAERLPRLSLVADDGLNGKAYPHLLNTYDWSLRVSVPVFDGLRISAREQTERAQADALEARRGELGEEVAFQVRDALLQVGSARELVQASRARLALAEAELEQARERFRAGVAGSADVFTASLRLSDARTADVDARTAYQAARVALAAAEGAVEGLR